MPSPMFKQLNWDVINNMPSEPITTRTGLWNGSSELFKGLRFESKDDLQYAVNCNLISYNQHFVVCKSQPHLWAVRCKKWNKGCNWRLRACRRKSHGLFEITKYVSLYTCVYPRLSQDHSQLGSKLIAREIQNVVNSKGPYDLYRYIAKEMPPFQCTIWELLYLPFSYCKTSLLGMVSVKFFNFYQRWKHHPYLQFLITI